MFSVIELFFGIGEDNFGRGKMGGLYIYNYRSDYWPRARGTFVPNWRVYASICGLSLPPNQLMEFKSVGVSKHLLGDGKPAGVLRYRHPLHHARGVSAALRWGQAGHERCAQETRHSGRPLQGSKYSTDMILNITLVAGAWTEREKMYHGGSFLKLADDDMDIQNPEAQNRELGGF